MTTFQKDKGVMSLAVVLVVGLFGLGTAITIATVALVGFNKNFDNKSGNQSFYTAEAAVEEGIYQYVKDDSVSGNFALTVNDIPPSSISFAISPSPRGWAYREVEGNAGNNLTNRKVKNTVLLFSAGAAFDYAVYSENDLSITGSTDITGDVFSNGIITCGGSSNIEGNACSNGTDPGATCGGHASSVEENVDIIPSPVIDPYYYGGIADCTSTLADVESDCLSATPTTGVVFVDDPGENGVLNGVDLVGNLTIRGNNIRLSGGTVITALNDYAALVIDGNLRIVGGATITGLVYVSGNTTFGTGDTHIIGSLISKGGVTYLGGNVTIDFEALSDPPGGIIITEDPEIVGWSEQ